MTEDQRLLVSSVRTGVSHHLQPRRISAVLLMASMASLVAAFGTVKLSFLLLFLATAGLDITLGRIRLVVPPRILVFYLLLAVTGVVWGLVGLFNPANFVVGVTDALRLYGIWSIAFVILYALLRSDRSLDLFHAAMVLAGLSIAVMNLVGLADTLGGLGLVSPRIRDQLGMNIGIHDGYVQITTQNIGALFLVVPYLMCLQFRRDAGSSNSFLTRLSLGLSLLLALLSGRRGLWLVVAVTPALILALSLVSGSYAQFRPWGKRILSGYVVLVAAAVVIGVTLPRLIPDSDILNRLQEAFSSVDERIIQKPFLIEGFKDAPVLGSGFGAPAGYLRDYERPWAGYELTYYQMLFNLGALGMTILVGLFAVYFALVIALFRRFKEGTAVPFALLVAFCSMLIGAYSNRYFGSFDLLFFVGLLPYLSSFQSGFRSGTSASEGAAA